MATNYERAVAEDLNIGHGSVSVTMPGGGSATGSKIGLHTFLHDTNNVIHFGARGDGVGDDSGAIQAAVDALPSAGGTVLLPPGTYPIVNTITWDTLKAVRFQGAGINATILDWRGGNSDQVIRIDSSLSNLPMGDLLSDFTIKNTKGATGLVGIQENASGIQTNRNLTRYERLVIQDCAIGIRLYNGIDNLSIADCGFFSCTNGIISTAPDSGVLAFAEVINCEFSDIDQWAMDLQIGGGCRLLSNKIHAPGTATTAGIRVDKFDSLTVANNTIELTGSTGIGFHIGSSALGGLNLSGVSIHANHFNYGGSAAGQIAIKLDFVNGAVLEGNAFASLETGISITANATNVRVGQQNWGTGVTNKVTDAGGSAVSILDGQIGYGFGTMAPKALVHAYVGGTAPSIDTASTQAVIQNNAATSGATGLTFLSGAATGTANIRFGTSANQAVASISYTYATQVLRLASPYIGLGPGTLLLTTGTGSPEGVITAPIGSLYLRTDGSTSTTLYVKTSGSSNTGWTAK